MAAAMEMIRFNGIKYEMLVAQDIWSARTCISSIPHGLKSQGNLLKSSCCFPRQRRQKTWLRLLLILKQACLPEYQKAQCAFKDSMIHWILQFTLRIAFRCVLHRCESQEIRCWKLYSSFFDYSESLDLQLKTCERKIKSNPSWKGTLIHCTQGGYGFESAINTYCEWSFRRFTYGNLVTTFTSSKWPSLDDFSVPCCCCQLRESNPKASLSHSIGSSDGRCVQRAGT